VSADESVSETTYQATKITQYETSVISISEHKNKYMEAVIDCLKSNVKQQHVGLLTNILAVLATHGWNRTESDDCVNTSLQNIVAPSSYPQPLYTVLLTH